jgi:hypothetical protein
MLAPTAYNRRIPRPRGARRHRWGDGATLLYLPARARICQWHVAVGDAFPPILWVMHGRYWAGDVPSLDEVWQTALEAMHGCYPHASLSRRIEHLRFSLIRLMVWADAGKLPERLASIAKDLLDRAIWCTWAISGDWPHIGYWRMLQGWVPEERAA